MSTFSALEKGITSSVSKLAEGEQDDWLEVITKRQALYQVLKGFMKHN